MTPVQFTQWLADMKAAGLAKNDREASDALGLTKARISAYKKTGTIQVQTDLACSALLAGLKPYG